MTNIEAIKAKLLEPWGGLVDCDMFKNPDGPEAVAVIEATVAENARKDAALADAHKLVSDISRQLGEAIGKLEGSEAVGVVDGWREKCEALVAENERRRKR